MIFVYWEAEHPAWLLPLLFRKDSKICIVEKNKILGRKLMATGGGRCNITNEACRNKDVTVDFFNSLGLELYADEEGRYYPYSNHAADVSYALERGIGKRQVHVYTGFCVEKVEKADDVFKISNGEKIICSDVLILSCGGKAAPFFGTTGDGYKFAKALGHSVNKVYPILTGIDCAGLEALKGIRAKGRMFEDGSLQIAQPVGGGDEIGFGRGDDLDRRGGKPGCVGGFRGGAAGWSRVLLGRR